MKRWSTKFDWSERIHAYNSGILQQQAKAESIAQQEDAAERTACMAQFRRQELAAARKMLTTVEFYLENCDEEQLENMTLSQAAQALNASSTIGRLAMARTDEPSERNPAKSSILTAFKDSVKRIYGQVPAPDTKSQTASTSNLAHVQNDSSQSPRT